MHVTVQELLKWKQLLIALNVTLLRPVRLKNAKNILVNCEIQLH